MRGRTDACYGKISVPSSAYKRAEFLHALSGHRRMHHKRFRRSCSDGDRLEIVHRVIGNLRIEAGVDPHRRTSNHQRVAIRWRPRRHSRTDIAASAGAVLNKKLLPKLIRELLTDQTSEDIPRTAGSERHDYTHRSIGVAVLRGLPLRRDAEKQR